MDKSDDDIQKKLEKISQDIQELKTIAKNQEEEHPNILKILKIKVFIYTNKILNGIDNILHK